MGVMRFPLHGLRPDGDPDLFFNGARQAKRRMDEVVRALHWQRLAAPYGAGQGYVQLDDAVLTDDWLFQRGETWDSDVIGKDVKQGAPARVARNLPLPTVTSEGADPPFVIAGPLPERGRRGLHPGAHAEGPCLVSAADGCLCRGRRRPRSLRRLRALPVADAAADHAAEARAGAGAGSGRGPRRRYHKAGPHLGRGHHDSRRAD